MRLGQQHTGHSDEDHETVHTRQGLEDLLDAGEELGLQVFSTRVWSDTRFAPQAADVVRAFIKYIESMALLFVYWGFRAQRLLWSLCAHNTR